MEALEKSYEYHSSLETFTAFVRREWKAVIIFGGGFSAVMLAAVFLLDPAFFYPRLQTDPLNYWLKVQNFVQNGSTAAQWSVNTPPFPYAAMPGVLRAPAVMLFDDFDKQLRAVQIANIPIVGGVALLSAYVFSWCMPRRRHSIVIAVAFTFVLLSPVWITNVFLPLADAPYALFTLAALVVAVRVLCSPVRLSRQWASIVAFVALFSIAFALRFTAPVVLVFTALIARGHWHEHSLSRRKSIAVTFGAVAIVWVLVQLNHQAIFERYFGEPLIFLRRGNAGATLLSLLGVSLPAQIVPNFVTAFGHPPAIADYKPIFSTVATDLVWLGIGLAISSIMIIGAWLVRQRFLPEIVYVLLPLPVLAAMLPSTTRYLVTYQPFLWIFFFTGAAFVAERTGLAGVLSRHRVATALVAIALAGSVVSLRVARTLGTASERSLAVSLAETPAYVRDVAGTFRDLRGFLERLPRDSALLIADRGLAGRWKAISGLDYYIPDSALSAVARSRPVYVLAECGTLEACTNWDWYRGQIRDRVTRFGSFEFDSVFAAQSNRATVEVYRLRASLPPAGAP